MCIFFVLKIILKRIFYYFFTDINQKKNIFLLTEKRVIYLFIVIVRFTYHFTVLVLFPVDGIS